MSNSSGSAQQDDQVLKASSVCLCADGSPKQKLPVLSHGESLCEKCLPAGRKVKVLRTAQMN